MTEQRILNRFRELLAIKERREGRKISQREVARATGLPKTTVDSYAKNDVRRFDEPTLRALCDYFSCTVGDLLVIEEIVEIDDDPNPEYEALLLETA